MRPLSSDLREFIRLLNTNSVKYVIVGAWALAFHGRLLIKNKRAANRDKDQGDIKLLERTRPPRR